ncbi:hypothetical protein NE237_022106 [Protea cynaroides]|uniref:Uncharacterized protein n=1 Tax=Protea cynaroides TaxID=273540 RepID=A0A9Q0H951_9MAGN|nr:hypothetical protein NE237_022106 [Protea cynaroides]
MDQRVEQIENKMESLSLGQKEVLNQITEMINKLTARVDQLASSNETAENSAFPVRVLEGRQGGHRCKKLFLIQATLDDSDNDVEMEVEDNTGDLAGDTPEISLHAISGTRAPETMRVKGNLQNKLVTVLIDSGSTHNFVSQTLANRVGLQPLSKGRLEVMVASGEKLISPGTQWLSTLGPIVWDFSKLQMSFHVEGKEVALHGLSTPENKVVSNLQLQRAARKKRGLLLQLFSMRSPQVTPTRPQLSPHVLKLLNQYKEVTAEPKSLPPRRVQDHKIPLQFGQGPISVKPYRYPYFQKTEIEKIVAEMLSSDHQSLRHLWAQKITTVAQQKWLYKLMGFDFVIEYKHGKENVVADALSRLEERGDNIGEFGAFSHPLPNWIDAIKEENNSNPTIQRLIRLVKDGRGNTSERSSVVPDDPRMLDP